MSQKQNKYSISQNFLTSGATIRRLIRHSDLCGDDLVVEIGAGKGHITRQLAEVCGRVVSYEIDPVLYDRLQRTLPGNVSLRRGDFLTARLPEKPYKVFANIPFSITTAILRKLTMDGNPLEAAWLIVEKGAAMRFCGRGRDTAMSLALKPWFDVRIAAALRREDFHPAPSVDCVLLELRRREKPDIPVGQRAAWLRFTETGLRQGIRGLTPHQIRRALQRDNAIPMSGTMRYVQWLCLFRCWRSMHGR